jgi:putative ABC transport system permease protein
MLNFLIETFLLGLKNLHLHKLRSLLTAMGIIFGVAAVIIMVAIGEGSKQAAMEQLRKLGARNIIVRSERPSESSDTSQRTQRVLDYGIKRVDLKRLENLPGLVKIVPLRDTEQRVVFGDIRAQANAIATTPDIFDVISLELQRGRYFNELDYEQAAGVCVIGSQVARQLFPYQDPRGQIIRVGSRDLVAISLKVVGVLEPTGLRTDGSGGMIARNLDQDVYFPLTLARSSFGDSINRPVPGGREQKIIELSEIWMQAQNIEDVEMLASMAENIMQINRKGTPDYQVKAPIQILRAAEEQKRMFNYIMGGIASFALVVGGIGIMNIMLATVTERTREIGIRRALGAKQKHITLQFLIETTVISLTGGLIGISLGVGMARTLPLLLGWLGSSAYPTSITTWSVVGSFVVSGLIGIGFGLYPAVKAARMNPIEALRHE